MSDATPSSIWNRRSNEKSTFLASTGAGTQDRQGSGVGNHNSQDNNNSDGNSHNYSHNRNHNNHSNGHGHSHGHGHGHSHGHGHGQGTHNPHHGNRNNNKNNHVQIPDHLNDQGLRIVKSRTGAKNILKDSWTIWFLHRGPGFKISNYLLATKQVGTFSTVEDFWEVYVHLRKIDKLPFTSEFQMFKKNVKPMWEDPNNAQGGKWVVRLKRPSKGKKTEQEEFASEEEAARIAAEKNTKHIKCRQKAALYWENLMLAIIGGGLTDKEEEAHKEQQGDAESQIMGVVISARRDEDIISVWTSDGSDDAGNQAIRDGIQRVLQLPEDFKFEYKVHQESLKEGAEKQALYEQTKESRHGRQQQKENVEGTKGDRDGELTKESSL